jgi:hypothetical protein
MVLTYVEPRYCGVVDSVRAPLLCVLLNELEEERRPVMAVK